MTPHQKTPKTGSASSENRSSQNINRCNTNGIDRKIFCTNDREILIEEAKHMNYVEDPQSDLPLQNGEIRLQSNCTHTYETSDTVPNGQYRNGPDQILPTEDYVSWTAEKPVKFLLGKEGVNGFEPISVPSLLMRNAERYPDKEALVFKNRINKWQYISYSQYLQDVRKVAKAFIKLGLERHRGVCIMGCNSVEWIYSNIGAIFAGGLSVGIYGTNSAESCLHIAIDCKAQVFVVENEAMLEKVLKIKRHLPDLKAIIQFKGKSSYRDILCLKEVLEIGENESDKELDGRLKLIAVNQACSLIYTSGTTGPPKGVMFSHDNLTWVARLMSIHYNAKMHDIVVSYLPLSHIAGQMIDIYGIITICGTVYFADPDALKGSLGKTLKEVKPTMFLGVPRVYEKIYEKMQEIGKNTSGLKRSIAIWAKSVGLKRSMRVENLNFKKPFGYDIANYLIFNKVKEALGLDRCREFACGGAPLSIDVEKYFRSLGIPVASGYGTSETAGPYIACTTNSYKIGSCGKPFIGCETKIFNPDKDGNGEICTRGRHVFMGYLNMKDKTLDTIDAENFTYSGDIGRFDDDGFLWITGRIKELIITSGGENVPPVLIEDEIKKHLPCISNAMVVGDRRKHLSALLTLKTEVDNDLVPLDNFTPPCNEWLRGLNCNITTLSELLTKRPETVMRKIQEGINKANSNAISNAQKVQKWQILPVDFSIPGGELGSTLKVKRQIVLNKYQDIIEKFYS